MGLYVPLATKGLNQDDQSFSSVLGIVFLQCLYYGDVVENDALRQYFKRIYISFVHTF